MESELKAHLIAVADAFSANSTLAASTIAMRATGDARFFVRIASGKSFNVSTYDRVIAWYSDNWPAGLAWPDGVPRPAVTADVVTA